MGDVNSVKVTRETLENTVPRAVIFQRGVARNALIRARLGRRGYTQVIHDQGLELVRRVCAYETPAAADEDAEVRGALAQLNQADEDFITVVEATLRHHHPTVAERVLGGIESSRDEGEAHAMMSVLLGRLEALGTSSQQEDRSALALLNTRIEPAERARLAALVKTASRLQPSGQPDEAALLAAEEAYFTNLRKLRAWYEEWSSIARATIKRRDQLIRLGLAHRRSRSGIESAIEEEEDVADVAEPSENE